MKIKILNQFGRKKLFLQSRVVCFAEIPSDIHGEAIGKIDSEVKEIEGDIRAKDTADAAISEAHTDVSTAVDAAFTKLEAVRTDDNSKEIDSYRASLEDARKAANDKIDNNKEEIYDPMAAFVEKRTNTAVLIDVNQEYYNNNIINSYDPKDLAWLAAKLTELETAKTDLTAMNAPKMEQDKIDFINGALSHQITNFLDRKSAIIAYYETEIDSHDDEALSSKIDDKTLTFHDTLAADSHIDYLTEIISALDEPDTTGLRALASAKVSKLSPIVYKADEYFLEEKATPEFKAAKTELGRLFALHQRTLQYVENIKAKGSKATEKELSNAQTWPDKTADDLAYQQAHCDKLGVSIDESSYNDLGTLPTLEIGDKPSSADGDTIDAEDLPVAKDDSPTSAPKDPEPVKPDVAPVSEPPTSRPIAAAAPAEAPKTASVTLDISNSALRREVTSTLHTLDTSRIPTATITIDGQNVSVVKVSTNVFKIEGGAPIPGNIDTVAAAVKEAALEKKRNSMG